MPEPEAYSERHKTLAEQVRELVQENTDKTLRRLREQPDGWQTDLHPDRLELE